MSNIRLLLTLPARESFCNKTFQVYIRILSDNSNRSRMKNAIVGDFYVFLQLQTLLWGPGSVLILVSTVWELILDYISLTMGQNIKNHRRCVTFISFCKLLGLSFCQKKKLGLSDIIFFIVSLIDCPAHLKIFVELLSSTFSLLQQFFGGYNTYTSPMSSHDFLHIKCCLPFT